MEKEAHIIGRYQGTEPGPLFICIGSMHGNEPSGIEAIKTVLNLLLQEPVTNPGFLFRGNMLGLIGNVRAAKKGVRYLRNDLNRMLNPGYVEKLFNSPQEMLSDEDLEIVELISLIREEIAANRTDKVVVLDLHSTSATGGIFVIVSDDPESIRIGTELHAPVILDFAREINGTTLGYFNKDNFNIDITSVVFESGQHQEPLSVFRAVSAVINCLRTIGCINAMDVENKHDALLMQYAAGLPRIARVFERFAIAKGTRFTLAKPFKNFEPVAEGEIIAYSEEKPVLASREGLILLPRLQEQGDDGFFLVRPLEE